MQALLKRGAILINSRLPFYKDPIADDFEMPRGIPVIETSITSLYVERKSIPKVETKTEPHLPVDAGNEETARTKALTQSQIALGDRGAGTSDKRLLLKRP